MECILQLYIETTKTTTIGKLDSVLENILNIKKNSFTTPLTTQIYKTLQNNIKVTQYVHSAPFINATYQTDS